MLFTHYFKYVVVVYDIHFYTYVVNEVVFITQRQVTSQKYD